MRVLEFKPLAEHVQLDDLAGIRTQVLKAKHPRINVVPSSGSDGLIMLQNGSCDGEGVGDKIESVAVWERRERNVRQFVECTTVRDAC